MKLFKNHRRIVNRNIYLSLIRGVVLKKRTLSRESQSNIRRGLSLFDYVELSRDIPEGFDHPLLDNSLYGLKEVISKYAGVRHLNPKILIEHGLFFGDYVQGLRENLFPNKVLTFGDYREQAIKSRYPEIDVVKIGPYIHYAEYLLSTIEFNAIKDGIGKTLLVFPSHSIDATKKDFDTREFINYIHYTKTKFCFDTVIICMYWKDVQLEYSNTYLKEGFKIVTAGHRNDIYFLSRLKSIISLSDATISNDLGTHLGYCIHLGKPHAILDQEVVIKGVDEKSSVLHKTEVNLRDQGQKALYKSERRNIICEFNELNSFITTTQKQLVDHYWGTNNVIDSERLHRAIL